jgi:hypothetical protein
MAQTYTWPQAIDVVVRLCVRTREGFEVLQRQVLALSREPGPQGERGPPGKLPVTKAWVDRVYDEGETVTRDGNLYQALVRTGKEPGHGDWQLLVPKGADGQSLTLLDTYEPGRAYRALDVVTVNATWFAAKKDNPGPCPGPDWKSGPTGKKGERGDRGEKGAEGKPGKDAARPVRWRPDVENYQAFPVYADGTEGAPFPVRPFIERYHSERG